ncbi:MAG: NADAR family protein [bacterium]
MKCLDKNQENMKFLFFWGHTQKTKHIDKSCLSQWFAAPFVLERITYPTAEHYMMAQKARLFGDEARVKKIMQSSHPHQAKTLGRQVENFDEVLWQHYRMDYVLAGNIAKFSQHKALAHFLLNTRSRILVEASPHDRIWGIGLDEKHPHTQQPQYWLGDNLLGFALMQVREQLSKKISVNH